MSGAGVLGAVTAGALLYSNSILIRPRRGFADLGGSDFVAQVTIEESHRDETHITEHPVEQGANIADHAFDMPASLTVRYAWSNSPSARNLLGAAAFSAAVCFFLAFPSSPSPCDCLCPCPWPCLPGPPSD